MNSDVTNNVVVVMQENQLVDSVVESSASGNTTEESEPRRGLDADVIQRQQPDHVFSKPPPCTRVYRVDPPYYQSWKPLRHIPKHVADKMKAFSPVSVPQHFSLLTL